MTIMLVVKIFNSTPTHNPLMGDWILINDQLHPSIRQMNGAFGSVNIKPTGKTVVSGWVNRICGFLDPDQGVQEAMFAMELDHVGKLYRFYKRVTFKFFLAKYFEKWRVWAIDSHFSLSRYLGLSQPQTHLKALPTKSFPDKYNLRFIISCAIRRRCPEDFISDNCTNYAALVGWI